MCVNIISARSVGEAKKNNGAFNKKAVARAAGKRSVEKIAVPEPATNRRRNYSIVSSSQFIEQIKNE